MTRVLQTVDVVTRDRKFTDYLRDLLRRFEKQIGNGLPSGTVNQTLRYVDTDTLESTSVLAVSAGRVTTSKAFQEQKFTVTGSTPSLDPENGQMQLWNLTANSTPTVTEFENGDSMTLHITDGASYTITWPATIRWIGGTEPTLDATEFNIVVLWKFNGIVFGSAIGAASVA